MLTPSDIHKIRQIIKQEIRNSSKAQPNTKPQKLTNRHRKITKQTESEWCDTSPAFGILGLESAQQLRNLIKNQTLQPNIHYRNAGTNKKPKYQFHITKCRDKIPCHC
ncbi:MAG TPA: hypothetical protein VK203_23735 [Nostocaceae cyanobacterium]|nr:hypothetical protein [Nostocaceae cyanobacterium]